jgi:hypothetical protein
MVERMPFRSTFGAAPWGEQSQRADYWPCFSVLQARRPTLRTIRYYTSGMVEFMRIQSFHLPSEG